mmetsp:Transcript_7813/g.20522  ORF Transcript_7813/g.20522 Transcript_7813/m.20522 type:complete len:207 (-) Transcript_7813:206-826(-)
MHFSPRLTCDGMTCEEARVRQSTGLGWITSWTLGTLTSSASVVRRLNSAAFPMQLKGSCRPRDQNSTISSLPEVRTRRHRRSWGCSHLCRLRHFRRRPYRRAEAAAPHRTWVMVTGAKALVGPLPSMTPAGGGTTTATHDSSATPSTAGRLQSTFWECRTHHPTTLKRRLPAEVQEQDVDQEPLVGFRWRSCVLAWQMLPRRRLRW